MRSADLRIAQVAGRSPWALADGPADVEAGEVAHAERPHREAELLERLVDLLRRRAFLEQQLGLRGRTAAIMRLPTKPSQRPPAPASCRSSCATVIAVASTSGAVFSPRTTSSSRITLAGLKKCSADHVLGPRRDRGDLVDVERRGIGGEDRRRACRVRRACAKTSFFSPCPRTPPRSRGRRPRRVVGRGAPGCSAMRWSDLVLR